MRVVALVGVRLQLLPGAATLTLPAGARVIDEIDEQLGGGLPMSCRGARCGICRVRVRAGSLLLEPPNRLEQDTLRFSYADPDERLGCQLWLRADAEGELTLEVVNAEVARR